MDIIYTNTVGTDVGILSVYDIDLEENITNEGNDFELKVPRGMYPLEIGCYVYADGTSYGGRIDSFEIDTSSSLVSYKGRTWRGMLTSKIVLPPSGQDYRILNGTAANVVNSLLNACDINDLFEIGDTVGPSYSNYQLPRYWTLYESIIRMLKDKGYRLDLQWDSSTHKVAILFEEVANIGENGEITADNYSIKLSKNVGANHVVALGSGDLRARQVVHRYVQQDGTIGNTQYYFGADEVTIVYDYNNAESLAELTQGADDLLTESMVEQSSSVNAEQLGANIGDLFTAIDESLGISITQTVINKVIKLSNNSSPSITYTIGEM